MKALAPISAIFGAGVSLRNSMYDHGMLKARKLKWPVVSVGNLSVGGAGKTPLTILLGRLLQKRQIAFDVLSRGYGRSDSKIRLVNEKGSPTDYGDEPLLLANKLSVPVIVGADRYAAGKHAEQLFSEVQPAHSGRWLHLLDDGFQHRGLYRDFDIVVVPQCDAVGKLLPEGRLREPLTSLRRANAIVLGPNQSTSELPIERQKVWRVERKITVKNVADRPIAFCGIANPKRFFDDLQSSGVEVLGEIVFSDHHAYREADVRSLLRKREEANSSGFITTEKDAMNLRRLPQEWLRQLEPISIVELEMTLINPEEAMQHLLEVIGESLQHAAKG